MRGFLRAGGLRNRHLRDLLDGNDSFIKGRRQEEAVLSR
jgi:hypothetical protein